MVLEFQELFDIVGPMEQMLLLGSMEEMLEVVVVENYLIL